jgi:archaellum component FlaC
VGALSDVLAPVDDRLDTIERTVQELAGEVRTLRETLVGVKDDLQRTTGLRGDRGVVERARDALTGGNQEQDRPGSAGSGDGP